MIQKNAKPTMQTESEYRKERIKKIEEDILHVQIKKSILQAQIITLEAYKHYLQNEQTQDHPQ